MEKQPLLVLALDGVIAKAGFNKFQNPANHLAGHCSYTALSFKIWSHSRKMCYFIAVAVWTQGCFNL